MKNSTLAIATIAACCFMAAPSYAQYGSGTGSYPERSSTQSQSYKAKKKAKAAAKAEKQRIEALKKKEAYEKELQMKEEAMKKDAMMKDGKGSGTEYTEDAMMKKEDVMMKKEGHGSGATYGSDQPAPAAIQGLPTNCPPNTTPQQNGTCLLNS